MSLNKFLPLCLATLGSVALAAPLSPIQESFVGIGTGNLNGQNTSPTPSDYFDGTETWVAATNAFSDRGYRGSTTSLDGAGGSVEVFRDNDFKSSELGTRALLVPNTQPNNLSYDATGSLYFSFQVNFDGYTARSNDGAQQGVLVDFMHENGGASPTSGGFGSRPFGVHIGGATGGDNDNLRLSLLTQSGSGSGDATEISFVDSGLNLASGTNTVQLRIIHSSATPANVDARYELSLNPSGPGDTPDFTHDEDFGLAINNSNFGLHSFGISQSLNDEQSVLVDGLYLGESSAIPEPGTLVLVGITLGALMLFRRRRS